MKVRERVLWVLLVYLGTTTVNAAYNCTKDASDACRFYQGITDNFGIVLLLLFLGLATVTCIGALIYFAASLVKNKKVTNKRRR